VRAAETITTGSEAVAMAGTPQLYVRILLDDIHHMMRCKICNGRRR
jgi:hypothetical protein